MNVIVFSKRFGHARQVELTRPLALAASLAVETAILAGTFFAGLGLGKSGLMGEPAAKVAEWSQSLEQQHAQVLLTKAQLQEKLDALASRVGLMNAHVIRLDALGRRLTDMANLNKGEFDFD